MGVIAEAVVLAVQALIHWFWTCTVERLADKYPVLVGIPLALLPIVVIAGIIYLLAG